jgi:hypothetical protein
MQSLVPGRGSTRTRRVTNYSETLAQFCAIYELTQGMSFDIEIRGLLCLKRLFETFSLRQIFPDLHWRWEQKTGVSLHEECLSVCLSVSCQANENVEVSSSFS